MIRALWERLFGRRRPHPEPDDGDDFGDEEFQPESR